MAQNKDILLVTRPIAPPWDEASKNFAYYLARNASPFNLTLLTKGIVKDLPENIRQIPVYTSNDFNSLQKAWLFFHLVKHKNDYAVLHFLFTPTRLNTFLLKLAIGGTRSRTIQTVATLREDLYSDAEIKKLIFADLVITYSDHAKDKLERLGFRNVERIYPGIDLEYYSPAPSDPAVREKLGLKMDDFAVAYPGEYVRLGTTDALAEMIVSDKDLWRSRKIKFILACRVKNADDRKKKISMVEKLEKADCLDRVVFTDTFAEMPKLYNASDVVIFPVRDMKGKFDVPLAAIEPMACQRPVIVSDLPILQEFAKKDNSLVIDRNNFDTLKGAILKLQADPARAASLGEAGRRYTQANFDIKEIAAKYQEIYARL